jgi:hypothetical protein
MWFGKAAAAGDSYAVQSLKTIFQKLEAICRLDSILEEEEDTEEKSTDMDNSGDPV